MRSDGELSDSDNERLQSKGQRSHNMSDSDDASETERLRGELLKAKKSSQSDDELDAYEVFPERSKPNRNRNKHIFEAREDVEDHDDAISIKPPQPQTEERPPSRHHKKKHRKKDKRERERHSRQSVEPEKPDSRSREIGQQNSAPNVVDRQRRIEAGWSAWKESLDETRWATWKQSSDEKDVVRRKHERILPPEPDRPSNSNRFGMQQQQRDRNNRFNRDDRRVENRNSGEYGGHREASRREFSMQQQQIRRGDLPSRGRDFGQRRQSRSPVQRRSQERWLPRTTHMTASPKPKSMTEQGRNANVTPLKTEGYGVKLETLKLEQDLTPPHVTVGTPTQDEPEDRLKNTEPISSSSEEREHGGDIENAELSNSEHESGSVADDDGDLSLESSEDDPSESGSASGDEELSSSERKKRRKRKRQEKRSKGKEKYSKFESSPEQSDIEEQDTHHEVEMEEPLSSADIERSLDIPRSLPVTPEHTPKDDPYSHLPAYFPAISGCRSVEEFSCLNRIEEGTYGVVYRAKDKRSDEVVALKRLKMEKEKEGFPITSLREINTLLKAQHQNIVTVREIVVGSNMDKIYIVMDYVEHDMRSLMESMKQPFLAGEVKTLLQQLLSGVRHLHESWILHRDLKTSNLLLSHKGVLKIGDFGLAREYGSPLKPYTPIVVTLWYRAPELLLGIKEYSTHIDMWSVGCIFAEFLTLKPLFPGKGEPDQLNKIFAELGTPSDRIWPGWSDLPCVKRFSFGTYPYNNLRKRFGAELSNEGFDLINKFLTFDPQRRITAKDALAHKWLHEAPLPVPTNMFPTWPAKSEKSRIPKKTGEASPRPPSGGKQFYKQLGEGDDDLLTSLNIKPRDVTGGFSLKFDPKLAMRM